MTYLGFLSMVGTVSGFRAVNAPFYLESRKETESPLGCFMHFHLTLWSLARAPNPFATKHSTVSPHLIHPQSLPPHRFGLSMQWLIFPWALSPAPLARYDVPS